MKRGMKIGTRLVLSQVVLMLLVAAAFLAPLYWFTQKTLLERAGGMQTQMLRQSVNMIDSFNEALKISARQFEKVFTSEFNGGFTVNPAVRVPVAGGSAPQLLMGKSAINGNNDLVDHFTALTGNVATLFALDGDDFVRVSTSVLKEDGARALGTKLDHASRAYSSLKAGDSYTGMVELFGREYVAIYSPLRDSDGKVVGASFVGVGATEGIASLLVRLSKVKLGESGHMLVMDGAKGSPTYGRFLLHPKLNGRAVEQAQDSQGQAYLRALLDDAQGSLQAMLPDEAAGSAPYMVSYAKYEPWGWVIVSEESRNELNRDNRAMLMMLAGGIGLLLLILAASLWLFTRALVARPVSRLVRDVGAIRASSDLTRRLAADRGDEVGEVAEAMNGLLASFQQAVNRTSHHAGELDHAARDLAQKAGEAAQASSVQRESAGEMSGHAEHLIFSAQRIEQVAAEASQVARSSQLAARNGNDCLVAAVEEVTRITSTLDEAAGNLKSLESQAQRITDIVNVIHDIADQTNLLALNAAIEAARAGEQGRGFAVVADEVRKLAERTTKSTQEIGGMISNMQQATDAAVTSMHLSVERAAEGAAITNGAREAIAGIVTDAERTMSVIGDIHQQLSEQRQTVENLTRQVEQVEQLAQGGNESAERSAATAARMAQLADELKDEVNAFHA